MKPFTFYLLWAGMLLLSAVPVFSQQEDPTESEDIAIEDLIHLKAETEASALQKMLNENVAASSRKKLSSRETPGIVSVISAEEIKHMGARDLIDVLRLVPGFEFAMDVDFMVGIGLRGNWANEGKVLVMVDGHEYNELCYQTVPFGNKFPVDQIQRIEIIRGPGSAIYGGTAEYGVINIITKGNSSFDGVQASGNYGFLPGVPGQKNGSLTLGKQINKDWHMDASVFRGARIISDQLYQDIYQDNDPVSLKDYSMSEANNASVGLSYKDMQIRGSWDQFQQQGPEFLVRYNHWYVSAKDEIAIGKKLIVAPSVYYTSQVPWSRQTVTDTSATYDYQVRAQRMKTNITASYDFTRRINLITGVEYFHDRAHSLQDDDNFGEGIASVGYHNLAFFGQGLMKHPWANVTLGFRYDKHNAFGAAFVPRLALTKRINQFHFKALYSHSYRAPGIENINLNENIRPEKSSTAELELGYQFTKDMLLAFNAYRIHTNDVIIYSYMDLDDGGYLEAYDNYQRTGTQGIEVIYKVKRSHWYANASYSFYQADRKHTVETYRVAEDPHLFVAFPAHKISINGSAALARNLWFSPSWVYVSERFGYDAVDSEATPILNRFDPYTTIHLFLNYDHLLTHGLSFGMGVYNLLNIKTPTVQAYNGDYGPIPGKSREISVKLSYEFSFKQK